jgi:hypothetical protein
LPEDGLVATCNAKFYLTRQVDEDGVLEDEHLADEHFALITYDWRYWEEVEVAGEGALPVCHPCWHLEAQP